MDIGMDDVGGEDLEALEFDRIGMFFRSDILEF